MRLDQIVLTPLKIIPLEAGDVMHAMRCSDPGFSGFGEAYFSLVQPGATKAWKRHRRMMLNLVVPVGCVSFAAVDDDSGMGRRFELGPRSYARLTVPPDLWLGFRGIAADTSIVLNVADIEHDPAEQDRADVGRFQFDWTRPCWPEGDDQRVLG